MTLSTSAKNDSNLAIRDLINYVYLQAKFGQPIDAVFFKVYRFIVKDKGKYMFSKKDINYISKLEDILLKYRLNELSDHELFYHLDHALRELNFRKEYNELIWKNSILLNLLK